MTVEHDAPAPGAPPPSDPAYNHHIVGPHAPVQGVFVNPCAEMVPSPEFDVEEYRGDLTRRLETLERMGNHYWQKYLGGKRESDWIDSQRNAHKADGIKIALSLLPKVEEKK